MNGIDLTPAQLDALFVRVEAHRLYLERLHARCAACFPPDDLLRRHARRALLAHRAFALSINDQRPAGVAHQYLKRSRSWPAV